MKPTSKWIATMAGIALTCFMIWYFHTIFFYILTAAVISLLSRPIAKQLSRVRIGRHLIPSGLKAAGTLTIITLIILGLGYAIVPVLLDKLAYFSTFDIHEVQASLHGPITDLENAINSAFPDANLSIRELIISQIEPLWSSGTLTTGLNSLTSGVISIGIGIFSVAFMTFFFLKDEKLLLTVILTLFPSDKEQNVRKALHSISHLLTRYIGGVCIESSIALAFISLGTRILGLDWGTSILIGFVVGVLNIIPYVGPMLGLLLASLITALTPIGGAEILTMIVSVLAIVLTFQLCDVAILQPLIYSNSVNAHPLEIFVVLLMAGYIGGIFGMLIAIPTFTVLRVIAKEFFNNTRFIQQLTKGLD